MSEKEMLEMIIEKLDHMDKRFDRIEEKLDVVEKRLDNVEKRLDNVEKRLEFLELRVQNLEEDMRDTKKDVGLLKESDRELPRRMNAVYDQVVFLTEFRTEMIMFRDETYKRFEQLNLKVDNLDQNMKILSNWLGEHELEIRRLRRA